MEQFTASEVRDRKRFEEWYATHSLDQERARQDEAARAIGNRHARRVAEAKARRAVKRAKVPP